MSWRGILATHSWIVVKEAGASAYQRFDYTAWGQPIWIDRFVPDGRWFGSVPDTIVAADLGTDPAGRCTGFLTGPPMVGESRSAWLRHWARLNGIDLAQGAYTGDGVAVDSANDRVDVNGLTKDEAKARMIAFLESEGTGRGAVTYRLRDWLFSRQRYWGEPFPIVFDEDGVAHAVPESMLPVELPDVPDYSPRTFEPEDDSSSPEPPLGRVPEWVEVELDLGDGRGTRRYRRETNTMPNWAGSCWYYLRYLDPHNEERFVDPDVEREWMGPREGKPLGGVDLRVLGWVTFVAGLVGSMLLVLVLYLPLMKFLGVDTFTPRRFQQPTTKTTASGKTVPSSAERRKEKNRYAGVRKAPPKYGGRR